MVVQAIGESLALMRAERLLLSYVLAVTVLAAAATGICDPLSFKLLIDSLARRNPRFFLLLSACLLALYTLLRLLTYASDLCAEKLRNRLCRELTTRLAMRFYDLPYHQVSGHEKGYFISRLYDEPLKVTEAVNLTVQFVGSAATCLCAAAVCLALSWQVSLIVSIVVPLFVVLANHFAAKIRQTSLAESEAEASLRENLGRAVDSYKSVRLFGLRPQVACRLDQLLRRSLDASYLRLRHSARFKGLSGGFLACAETAVLVGAGFQVLRGALSIGGLFAFVSAYWRVANSFHSLAGLVPSYTRVAAQLERIREIEAAAVRPPCSDLGLRRLIVRDLAFAHRGRPLLEGLDLDWESGEKLLVIGPNGCGKSTLAHILTGFLEVPDGGLVLPGLARISALLTPFGFIPGSLRENLSGEQLSARRRFLLQRLVTQFGLGSALDRDPVSLSEGEKKKAQVVMALAKEADFYIFDEPLASVDAQSKDAIMDAIFSVTEGRNLLVILHGDDQYRWRFDRVIDLRQPAMVAAGR